MYGGYFGDYLLRKELISSSEYDEISSLSCLDFIENLKNVKKISTEDIDKLVLAFRSEMDLTDERLEAIKSGDIDKIINAMTYCVEDDFDYAHNIFLKWLLKAIHSFVSPKKLIIKPVRVTRKYAFENLAYLEIEEPLGLSVSLSGNGTNLLTIANSFLDFGFTEMDEESFDALCEFLNSICGMYVSEISVQEDIEADLKVPSYYKDQMMKARPKYFKNHIMSSGGLIHLMPLVIDNKEIELLVTQNTINEFQPSKDI